MIELKPGQKVIVKKTGEIGEVICADGSLKDLEYLVAFKKDGEIFEKGEIHPLKFDVGEFVETKIKYAEKIFGEIVELRYKKDLNTVEYHISVKDPENNNHGIFIFYEEHLEKLSSLK